MADSKFPLRGLRRHLTSWAMEQAQQWAEERNKILSEDEVRIDVDELFFVRWRDEGDWVCWELQDGGGWIINVVVDFKEGTVTVGD